MTNFVTLVTKKISLITKKINEKITKFKETHYNSMRSKMCSKLPFRLPFSFFGLPISLLFTVSFFEHTLMQDIQIQTTATNNSLASYQSDNLQDNVENTIEDVIKMSSEEQLKSKFEKIIKNMEVAIEREKILSIEETRGKLEEEVEKMIEINHTPIETEYETPSVIECSNYTKSILDYAREGNKRAVECLIKYNNVVIEDTFDNNSFNNNTDCNTSDSIERVFEVDPNQENTVMITTRYCKNTAPETSAPETLLYYAIMQGLDKNIEPENTTLLSLLLSSHDYKYSSVQETDNIG